MLDLYWLGITQKGEPKEFHRLAGMVKAHLEERRQKKNRGEYNQVGTRRPRSASPALVNPEALTWKEGDMHAIQQVRHLQ